jgi:NTE family protein
MLHALTERQVTPDVLVGTSAGAVNGAFLAGHGTGHAALDRLADSWASVRRRDVFPLQPWPFLLSGTTRRTALCAPRGLARLIVDHLTFADLDQAQIPVHVVATDLLSGAEVLLSAGDALTAVLASAAIPGVYPAVDRDGRTLVDGGLANNAAISQAVALGADRVFVLPTGFACALTEAPARPLGMALHALGLLIQQRLINDAAVYADRVELIVLPPLCPLTVSPADFRHARELIDRARAAAGAWLDDGMPDTTRPDRVLAFHEHTGAAPRLPAASRSAVADARAHRGRIEQPCRPRVRGPSERTVRPQGR